VLSRIQTGHVARLLEERWPGVRVEIIETTPVGDRDKSTPLTQLGKGVFVKGVEELMARGEADAAIHSLKDVPTEETAGLVLAGFPIRVDPRDGLISRGGESFEALPINAVVGTGSPRRAAQLRAMRRDIRIAELRGNLDTRIAKLRSGQYDAIAVAVAGVQRLGREAEVTEVFEFDRVTPAAGQGALVVQCREDDAAMRQLLAGIDDARVRAEVLAERAFLATLGGGCQIPAGAVGRADGGELSLVGVVASDDGSRFERRRLVGSVGHPAELGRELAEALLPLARGLLAPVGGA
jgi:hydroxymethylbilane synthase